MPALLSAQFHFIDALKNTCEKQQQMSALYFPPIWLLSWLRFAKYRFCQNSVFSVFSGAVFGPFHYTPSKVVDVYSAIWFQPFILHIADASKEHKYKKKYKVKILHFKVFSKKSLTRRRCFISKVKCWLSIQRHLKHDKRASKEEKSFVVSTFFPFTLIVARSEK